MPTAVQAKVDMEQLRAYEDSVEASLDIVKEALEGKDTPKNELKEAIEAVDAVFSKQKTDRMDLYSYLKIGQRLLIRDKVEDVLTKEQLRWLLEEDRAKLERVLGRIAVRKKQIKEGETEAKAVKEISELVQVLKNDDVIKSFTVSRQAGQVPDILKNQTGDEWTVKKQNITDARIAVFGSDLTDSNKIAEWIIQNGKTLEDVQKALIDNIKTLARLKTPPPPKPPSKPPVKPEPTKKEIKVPKITFLKLADGKEIKLDEMNRRKIQQIITKLEQKFKTPGAVKVGEKELANELEAVKKYFKERFESQITPPKAGPPQRKQKVAADTPGKPKTQLPRPSMAPTAPLAPPKPSPAPPTAPKMADTIKALEQEAQQDESLRINLNLLKTLKDLKGKSAAELKADAATRGLDWSDDFCKNLEAWLKGIDVDFENVIKPVATPRDMEDNRAKIIDIANKREVDLIRNKWDGKINDYIMRRPSAPPTTKKTPSKKPSPQKPTPKAKPAPTGPKLTLLEEAAEKDKDLKNAMVVLEASEDFRGKDSARIREKIGFGFEDSDKLRNWLNTNKNNKTLIQAKATTPQGLDKAKAKIMKIYGELNKQIADVLRDYAYSKKAPAKKTTAGPQVAPKVKKAPATREIPDFIQPPALQQMAGEVTQKDPRKVSRFIAAWDVYSGRVEAVDPNQQTNITAIFKRAVQIYGKPNPPDKVTTVIKRRVAKLLENDIPTRSSIKFEFKGYPELLETVCDNDTELADKIKKLFDVLYLNPDNFPDKDALIGLQTSIRNLLLKKIPIDVCKEKLPDNPSVADIIKVLRDKVGMVDLADKIDDIKKEVEKFDRFESSINKYLSTKTSAQKPPPGGAPPGPGTTGAPPGTPSGGGQQQAPAGGQQTGSGAPGGQQQAPASGGQQAPAVTVGPQGPANAPNVITRSDIDTMVPKVLENPALFHDHDPASLAIIKLITTNDTIQQHGITELEKFLLKPRNVSSLNIDAKYMQKDRSKLEADLTTVDAQLKQNPNDVALQDQKDQIELALASKMSKSEVRNWMEKITQQIEAKDEEIADMRSELGGRSVKIDRDKLRSDLKLARTKRDALKNKNKKLQVLLDLKDGTIHYDSTSQLLAMINVFIAEESGSKKSMLDIAQDVDKQIEAERKEAMGWKSKLSTGLNVGYWLFSGGTLLKPRLRTTLEALAKDPAFEKIPQEKWKALAKAHNNLGAVQAWINNLEGDKETNITEILPRIIAYLEMALHDGNVRYLRFDSAKRAKNLIKNLKAIRHKYILNKVKGAASEKATDVDAMSAYFEELNKATVLKNEISKSILRLRAGKMLGLTTAAAVTGGVGGTAFGLGGLATKLGILGGGAALTTGMASLNVEKEETKQALRRGAARGVCTTGLAIGAMSLSPLLLPAALLGVFAPNLFDALKTKEGRAKLKEGTTKSVKGGATVVGAGAKTGLWGAKLVAKVGLVGGLMGIPLLFPQVRSWMKGSIPSWVKSPSMPSFMKPSATPPPSAPPDMMGAEPSPA